MVLRSLPIFFLILLSKCLYSQNAFEFSLGYVHDRNLDNPGLNILIMDPPIIDNRYSYHIHFRYERQFKKCVFGLAGLRLTIRKFNYHHPWSRSVYGDFMHHTLELPAGVRFKKQLSDNLKLRFDVEGGFNYVLTADRKTLYADNQPGNHFQLLKRRQWSPFLQSGFGWETRISHQSYLSVFMSYQVQLKPLFRYRLFNSLGFDVYGREIYTHNLSFGVTYTFAMKTKWSGAPAAQPGKN